jgi:hypothetical protein
LTLSTIHRDNYLTEKKMKRTFVICCLLAVLFIQNINSQTLGDLYTERNAGFTMSMPRGWQTMDANQKYLMIVGPTENGFTPNVGFADDTFSGPLSEYSDSVLSVIGQFYADLTIINRGNFSTNSGLRGEYATIQGRMGEISVRQKMFIFPNASRGGIILITGTAPAANGERFDPIFDECVKTFRWTR